jgi:hypothetical protein
MRLAVLDSSQKIVASSLVLHLDAAQLRSYPGSGTTWTDISGNSNNVTTVNSPTFTSSNGGYFSFNGSTQYANRASTVITTNSNYSMCAWIRPASINQLGLAVHNGRETGSSGNGFAFGVGNGNGNPGNKLQVLFSGSAWFDPGYTYPSANTWYYVVITRDSATTKCYVNGIQTPNTSGNSGSPPTTQFSVGGPDPTWGSARFNGGIAIVQGYTKELSSTEVLQNYNALKSRFGL